MTKIRISITKDVLQQSCKCQRKQDSCAFAVAVRDLFPFAIVNSETIIPDLMDCDKRCKELNISEMYPSQGVKERVMFSIPKKMQDFIEEFDNSTEEEILAMPEQEFELEIPDWAVEKYVNIDEVKQLLETHPTLSLIESIQ